MVTEATNKPKPETARRTLIITSIISPDGKPEHWGDRDTNQKLRFKAKDGEQEYLYDCIRNTLFESIKPGETIDADVSKRSQTGNDGEVHTYRSVAQIYKDGQPVGGQNKKGQGYSRNTPEDRQFERERTAFNGIMALLGNGIIDLIHPLSVRALKWAEDALSGTPSPSPTPAQKPHALEGTESPKSSKTPSDKAFDDLKSATDPQTFGELFTWVATHGKNYTRTWLFKTISITEQEVVANNPKRLSDAFHEIKNLMQW